MLGQYHDGKDYFHHQRISEYSRRYLHADSHLVNGLGFISYDVVSLVGKFEDEFDIEVPDRKIKLMKTVDDIVKFIEAATEE